MSSLPTGPDRGLARLVEEGFQARHLHGHLVLEHVPYLDGAGDVRYGALAEPLAFAGDQALPPESHVVWFQGEAPCGTDGARLDVVHSETLKDLFPGFHVNFMFSRKPQLGYPDHYTKMTTYAAILMAPAQAIDPRATANTFARLPEFDDDSPFAYRDSAAPRAGISAINARLRGQRVAIVGVGGTGSYVLDMVAKTEVAEIHLFDADEFVNHNAFRSPGAATLEVVTSRPNKVEHFAATYSLMRSGVVPHPVMVGAGNATELTDMDFVFVCADHSPDVADVASWLRARQIPFVDVGMAITSVDGRLRGVARTTLVASNTPDAITIPATATDDEYDANIQLGEVNALNAALAVLRWKRHAGLLLDQRGEDQSVYSIGLNAIANTER